MVHHETIAGARVAVVTLDRPDKLNALTPTMLRGLPAAAREIRRDRTVRAVLLTGAGGSFSAGLDFAATLRRPAAVAAGFLPGADGANLFQRAAWCWRRLPVPVIAAVDGHCLGGGLQIALGADLRVTAPDARWSVLEARWGLVPDMAGMRLLVDAVGAGRTTWLAMSAAELDGAEAARIGLATHLAGDGDAQALARELAARLIGRSPDQLAAVKRLLRRAHRGPRATFRRERLAQLSLLLKENTARARTAAAAGEAPRFTRRGAPLRRRR
ncbi:enoyl-CoA hydratase [Corynebacterium sphenisci DSM 44792]|uniref:Enoyl-CoA hydratase n=1 Tax=Corynebacterium sphenisci DSM 44792 TaxID=1437874 RepID=A0A1L7D0E1_9CORY|nr:enoyl-CoA hydratase [Corynebacterium sphenisci DSM 44792]